VPFFIDFKVLKLSKFQNGSPATNKKTKEQQQQQTFHHTTTKTEAAVDIPHIVQGLANIYIY
jgi:hypothetical protein